MQVIHCTKKLLSELGVSDSKVRPDYPSRIFGPWHANLIRIERRKCILFTNDSTLFSFLVPGVKKNDDFHDLFLLNLNSNLVIEGFVQRDTLKALAEYSEIAIAPTTNRSVLGSMNDLAYQVESLISQAGGLGKANILRINMMLNRIPMGALKYHSAIEKVYRLFGRTESVRMPE